MNYLAGERIPPRPPPAAASGWLARARALFFATKASAVVTVLLGAATVWLAWHLWLWGVRHAMFSTGGQGSQACLAPGVGACWAVVGDKLRLILFGIYPYEQQWRAGIAMAILVVMYAVSAMPRFWGWRLSAAWTVALAAFGVLMWGGVFGLPWVPDDQWGGLPVTLILATLGISAGFPLAIVLALVRHQAKGGVGKALAVAYIELARSVPLLAVLFLASVMFPLFLPPEWNLSKLFRVFVAFALFTAAYLAEVIRGGLQALPLGQYEAAAALGLSRWVTTTRVILPQALATVLPAIVNVFIGFFKATSIVVVIGLFDLMTAAKRATADPQVEGFSTEVYLFVALIYFAFCYAMSAYSAHLQRRLDASRPGTPPP
ncbi:amino acid ABC transporter permease [Ramlibacter sp. G-1-2-2]|uniref:Amino acid ABC transporter permease n=1 Tax=Ramlibacter agri TaxID=2728837 RepID=A0A848H5K2_9BURK|nr:amino acid ABC transporter permease [Ramlibacter agri]